MHKWIAGVASGAAADRIVVHCEAVSILTTRACAWIRAFVVDARLVLRAFGTDDTARSTGRWNPRESGLALAHRVSVLRAAVAVGSTGRWLTGINRPWQRCHVQDGATIYRVTGVARQAGAGRRVINDAARSTLAAGAGARIHTFVVEACFGAVAVGIGDAFGPARNVWITEVLWQAHARTDAVTLVAHRVGTAGRRIARCSVPHCRDGLCTGIIILNVINDNRIHYCVPRGAGSPESIMKKK